MKADPELRFTPSSAEWLPSLGQFAVPVTTPWSCSLAQAR